MQRIGETLKNLPPLEWIVKDAVASRAIHLLYGSNLGHVRSVATRMAVAVGRGEAGRWGDVEQGSVVYSALDIGVELLAPHFAELGVEPDDPVGIYYMDPDCSKHYLTQGCTPDPTPRLLLIDSWAGLEALNEPELMGLRPEEKTLTRIRTLRRLAVDQNLAVVVLAEGAKREQSVRGSSMVLGAFDGFLHAKWEREGRGWSVWTVHRSCPSHNLFLSR